MISLAKGSLLHRVSLPDARFDRVLVVPICGEDPQGLCERIRELRSSGPALVVLVLNESQVTPPAYRMLNDAILSVAKQFDWSDRNLGLWILDARVPSREFRIGNVGWARDQGLRLVLDLKRSGQFFGEWIHFSDGDTIFGADFFEVEVWAGTVGASVLFRPFLHQIENASVFERQGILIYELFLRYLRLGLRDAGSPFSYHSVGSTQSLKLGALEILGGVPHVSAGEDFHLFEKASKVFEIFEAPRRFTVWPSGRVSDRVPFGTGRSVRENAELLEQECHPSWISPKAFVALRALHAGVVQECLSSDLIPARAPPSLEKAIEKAWRVSRSASPNPLERWKAFYRIFDALKEIQFLRCFEEVPWFDAIKKFGLQEFSESLALDDNSLLESSRKLYELEVGAVIPMGLTLPCYQSIRSRCSDLRQAFADHPGA